MVKINNIISNHSYYYLNHIMYMYWLICTRQDVQSNKEKAAKGYQGQRKGQENWILSENMFSLYTEFWNKINFGKIFQYFPRSLGHNALLLLVPLESSEPSGPCWRHSAVVNRPKRSNSLCKNLENCHHALNLIKMTCNILGIILLPHKIKIRKCT